MAKKIVVIDDEPDISGGIAEYLTHLGYEAFPAVTAEEGIKIIARELPQLVLIDIGLPGMSGFEAIQKISGDFPNSPIVVMTGSQDDEFVKKAFDMGVCEFISKPVSLETLHTKIVRGIIGDPL